MNKVEAQILVHDEVALRDTVDSLALQTRAGERPPKMEFSYR